MLFRSAPVLFALTANTLIIAITATSPNCFFIVLLNKKNKKFNGVYCMVLLIKCNTKKKEINFLLKELGNTSKKNRFLLLNKFKKRIWLQKTDRDLYSTGCSFAQTVGNLHFSTENYKKLTEISVFPQRITKNRQKSPFLHRELQKTVCGEHFSP